MNRKNIVIMGATVLLSTILLGCKQTTKPKPKTAGSPPLTVNKDNRTVDLTMQGAQHYSPFDQNNQVKAEVHTTPDAQLYLKYPIKNNAYDYHVHSQGKGRYQMVFDNLRMQNEDKFPEFNEIMVKSPSYTKSAQSMIGLHTSTDSIKKSITQNVQSELKKNDLINEELDNHANINVDGKNTNPTNLKVNIGSDVTPPPRDAVIATLKALRNTDMSTFSNVTISVGAKSGQYWYRFIPFEIKTMPLDHMSTNDLNYISVDNNVSE